MKYLIFLLAMLCAASAWPASKTFDQAQWATGKMDEQTPGDSNGTGTTQSLDYNWYHANAPMRQDVLDDSFTLISDASTYDSAVLLLVLGTIGPVTPDEMKIFGKRLSASFTENGVSYLRRSTAAAWTTPGGDVGVGCTDTLTITAADLVNDTIYFHIDTGFIRYMVETDNIGWLLVAENVVDRFPFQICTEDHTTAAKRPRLTVYYHTTAVPTAARVIHKAYLRKVTP